LLFGSAYCISGKHHTRTRHSDREVSWGGRVLLLHRSLHQPRLQSKQNSDPGLVSFVSNETVVRTILAFYSRARISIFLLYRHADSLVPRHDLIPLANVPLCLRLTYRNHWKCAGHCPYARQRVALDPLCSYRPYRAHSSPSARRRERLPQSVRFLEAGRKTYRDPPAAYLSCATWLLRWDDRGLSLDGDEEQAAKVLHIHRPFGSSALFCTNRSPEIRCSVSLTSNNLPWSQSPKSRSEAGTMPLMTKSWNSNSERRNPQNITTTYPNF
jgi:hypothetical protein